MFTHMVFELFSFSFEKKDLQFITQPKTKNTKTGEFETSLLIHLIHSPSHVDFSSEVTTALRVLTAPWSW